MSRRVLVAYATKYGATQGIAERIGQVLPREGLQADVASVDQVRDLAPYEAVVLGSSLYIGNWRKDATRFLTDRQNELAKRPLWLFSSGLTGENDMEVADETRLPRAVRSIADRLGPRDIVFFDGWIDPKKLSFLERLTMRVVKAPSGDFRDFKAITRWARSIASYLKGGNQEA